MCRLCHIGAGDVKRLDIHASKRDTEGMAHNTYLRMPPHMVERCSALQTELETLGIQASTKDCHDMLVAEALERIRSKRLDTVLA